MLIARFFGKNEKSLIEKNAAKQERIIVKKTIKPFDSPIIKIEISIKA